MDDLAEMNKDELLALAQDLDIPGRSKMNKDELLDAVTEYTNHPSSSPSDDGVVPPPFSTPLPQTQEGALPIERFGQVPQPVLPIQVPVADDRLGDEVLAPAGFKHLGHFDPDAKVADSAFIVPPKSKRPAFDNYVPPRRPIAVTSIAHYPASNTV